MGLLTQSGIDPYGGKAEGRILRRRSCQLTGNAPRIDRQILARKRLAVTDRHALERQSIGIRSQFQIVSYMHRSWQEADLLAKLLAQTTNPLQQFAVLPAIHHWNQTVTDLEIRHIVTVS